MTRLLEIASELSALNSEKVNLTISANNQQDDYEARKIALAPADGWPGKNAEERKLAEIRSASTDETLGKIHAKIYDLNGKLAQVEASIYALETERRAIEWGITARLADALTDYVHRQNPGKVAAVQAAPVVTAQIIDEDIPF